MVQINDQFLPDEGSALVRLSKGITAEEESHAGKYGGFFRVVEGQLGGNMSGLVLRLLGDEDLSDEDIAVFVLGISGVTERELFGHAMLNYLNVLRDLKGAGPDCFTDFCVGASNLLSLLNFWITFVVEPVGMTLNKAILGPIVEISEQLDVWGVLHLLKLRLMVLRNRHAQPAKPLVPPASNLPLLATTKVNTITRAIIAAQEFYLHKVHVSEFMVASWNRPESCPNLHALLRLSLRVRNWVIYQIVTAMPNRVCSVMRKFITVAEILYKNQDYNGLMMITSAFEHAAVFRLHHFREHLPSRYLKALERLRGIMSPLHGSAAYFADIEGKNSPCIPCISIILRQVVGIRDRMRCYLDGVVATTDVSSLPPAIDYTHSDYTTNTVERVAECEPHRPGEMLVYNLSRIVATGEVVHSFITHTSHAYVPVVPKEFVDAVLGIPSIDEDLLFDKSLQLRRPEKAPFHGDKVKSIREIRPSFLTSWLRTRGVRPKTAEKVRRIPAPLLEDVSHEVLRQHGIRKLQYRKAVHELFHDRSVRVEVDELPDINLWTCEDVVQWLESMGEERVPQDIIESFRRSGVNGSTLVDMEIDDLHRLGVSQHAVRRHIMGVLERKMVEARWDPQSSHGEEFESRSNVVVGTFPARPVRKIPSVSKFFFGDRRGANAQDAVPGSGGDEGIFSLRPRKTEPPTNREKWNVDDEADADEDSGHVDGPFKTLVPRAAPQHSSSY
eukprot:CAMPEP_0119120190 /NCGR_PEP_ID=MMETSP1310-20130426/1338_1 /TAXON_ID=464262 /ORGANISM="Genus nov. species nov., Strain RCC2339" /LENGTH=726 /DNA_ID=CAMNT_0007109657 /DNA_START=121 /DNA_END=2301 /DNA_ORIENTATION=-